MIIMNEDTKVYIVRAIMLITLNVIMLIWGGIHLYRYFTGEPFVFRGVAGENSQNLILPIIFGVLILVEIYLILKNGIKSLLT